MKKVWCLFLFLFLTTNFYSQNLKNVKVEKIIFYNNINCKGNGKFISLPHTVVKPFGIINGCYKIFLKKLNYKWFIVGKIKTASEIYFNGKLMEKSGKIGEMFIENYKKLIFFRIPENLNKEKNILTIKFQSTDIDGGFYYPVLKVGSDEQVLKFIRKKEISSFIKESFIISVLSFVFLFLIFLYINKVKNPEYLSIGFFIFFYLIYYILNSNIFVNSSLNNFFIQKIKFSFFMLAPIFFLKFCIDIYELKNKYFYKILNCINIFIVIFFILFYHSSLWAYKFFKIICVLIFLIYIAIIINLSLLGFKFNQHSEIKIVTYGITIFLIIAILEFSGIITNEITDFGVVLLILFCSFALTVRFARLTRELDFFSSKLLKIRDEERKRLGKDLHDGLGQSLLAIKLKLQLYNRKTGIFRDVIDDISNTIEEMRNICEELNPSLLENLGLKEAIEETLKKCSKYFPIKVNYEIEDINLPFNTSEQIFRIFQECLTNTIKHSQAKELFFKLKRTNTGINFHFVDNGIGFVSSKVKKGIGILSIRERVKKLKGKCKIISTPNKGTEIIIEIPWKK